MRRCHRSGPWLAACQISARSSAASKSGANVGAAAAPTFGVGYDADQDLADIWRSASHGPLVWHRLIHYMTDRRTHEERWVGALEGTEVPLAFVWGMQDPVSGAHMAERIRERLPDAPFTALEDVGHWPSLEAPDRVVRAVLGR